MFDLKQNKASTASNHISNTKRIPKILRRYIGEKIISLIRLFNIDSNVYKTTMLS